MMSGFSPTGDDTSSVSLSAGHSPIVSFPPSNAQGSSSKDDAIYPKGTEQRVSIETEHPVAPTANSLASCNLAPRNDVNSISDDELPSETVELSPKNNHDDGLPLNRIAIVRQQQGISERTIARRLGVDVRTYRKLEDPRANLTLKQLYELQKAFDVPAADLIEDRQDLSRPVEERAMMIKVMKTAVAIRELKANPRIERMATMLCEQLVELMPELRDVSGWPQFGARRGAAAVSKILQTPIDLSELRHFDG